MPLYLHKNKTTFLVAFLLLFSLLMLQAYLFSTSDSSKEQSQVRLTQLEKEKWPEDASTINKTNKNSTKNASEQVPVRDKKHNNTPQASPYNYNFLLKVLLVTLLIIIVMYWCINFLFRYLENKSLYNNLSFQAGIQLADLKEFSTATTAKSALKSTNKTPLTAKEVPSNELKDPIPHPVSDDEERSKKQQESDSKLLQKDYSKVQLENHQKASNNKKNVLYTGKNVSKSAIINARLFAVKNICFEIAKRPFLIVFGTIYHSLRFLGHMLTDRSFQKNLFKEFRKIETLYLVILSINYYILQYFYYKHALSGWLYFPLVFSVIGFPSLMRYNWKCGLTYLLLFYIVFGTWQLAIVLESATPQTAIDLSGFWYFTGTLTAIGFLYWLNKKIVGLGGFQILILLISVSVAITLHLFVMPDLFPTYSSNGTPLQSIYMLLISTIGYNILSITAQLTPKKQTPIRKSTPDPTDDTAKTLPKKDSDSKTTAKKAAKKAPEVVNQQSNGWYKKISLKNLLEIDMSLKNLHQFSDFIVLYLPDAVQLQSLNLSYNKLEVLPYEITELTQLKQLDLSYNQLTAIDHDIGYLTTLETLHLSNNQISSITAELCKLKQLKQLDVSNNPLPIEQVQLLRDYLPDTQIIHGQLQHTKPEQLIRYKLHDELMQPDKEHALESQLSNLNLHVFTDDIMLQFKDLILLNLSGNQLQAIPSFVRDYKNLCILNLEKNQLKTIDQNLEQNTQLRSLNLSDNPLESFEATLLNLETLLMNNMQLHQLPDWLMHQVCLETLSLEHNLIEKISEEIEVLQQLKNINLSYNYQLQEFTALSTLKKLQRVELNGMQWKNSNLPSSLEKLVQIGELSIANNLFESIPTSVYHLTQLQRLDLSHNNIHTIASDIKQLKKLQYLDLSNNKLQRLPLEITELTKLKELDLSNNPISDKAISMLRHQLPDCKLFHSKTVYDKSVSSADLMQENEQKIKQLLNDELKNAHEVLILTALMHQQLPHIPTHLLSTFKNLKVILLSGNRLTEIPEGLYRLPKLATILLNHNMLKQIPAALSKLKNLVELDLSHNPLRFIERNLSRLQQLQRIKLESCLLTIFPHVLSQMTNLKSINIADNKIKELPDSIYQLIELETLNLNYTGIYQLPNSFNKLKKLKELQLAGNNLLKLPEMLMKLPQLNNLNLSYNPNLYLSKQVFSKLKKLQKLNIAGLQLEADDCSFMNEIAGVEELDASDNILDAVPEAVLNCKKIRRLNLSNNQLRQLPEQFNTLHTLQVLQLNNNKIDTVIDQIDQLTKLKEVQLINNPIAQEEIEQLQAALPNTIIKF